MTTECLLNYPLQSSKRNLEIPLNSEFDILVALLISMSYFRCCNLDDVDIMMLEVILWNVSGKSCCLQWKVLRLIMAGLVEFAYLSLQKLLLPLVMLWSGSLHFRGFVHYHQGREHLCRKTWCWLHIDQKAIKKNGTLILGDILRTFNLKAHLHSDILPPTRPYLFQQSYTS